MRIAHVTDCYLPRLGGIEIQVHDLAAHQIAAGHHAEVLTSTAAGRQVAAGLPGAAVPVRRLDALAGNVPSATGLDELGAAIRSGRYDVVHAHSSTVSPLAWSAVGAASRAGVPVVLTLHSMLSPKARMLALSAGAVGWSQWPVAWTAVSSAAAAPLRAVLGDDRVSVLPNGIDLDSWRPVPALVPAPQAARVPPLVRTDGFTIVSVMRLSQRKRPLALLEVLRRIRAELPAGIPLRAVIVGEGPQRQRMERSMRATGLGSWVTLTGVLSRAAVRDVMTASDVYLAPAERESFGIAALEARSAGLPVVAMASGGVREFVRHGVEGLLVGSDAEMASATAQLLTSPALAIMQAHNRQSVPDLAWPQVVDRTTQTYELAGLQTSGRPMRTLLPVGA